MIRFAEVSIGSGDPPRCIRCHGPNSEPAYLPAAEIGVVIERACAEWTDGTGPNLLLAGPEPFGHPDLPRLVATATAAGCIRLGADTDAGALRSPQNARGALIAGLRQLRVRMLAGTPDLHDALVGTPGALDATLAGLRTYRSVAESEGVAVSVTCIVPMCRHNIHGVPAAVGAAVAAGADGVLLRLEDAGLGLASSAPWIRAACDTGVVNGVWVEVDGMPFCAMPEYELHLADVYRRREGAKSAACAACPLEPLCAGACADASPDQLSELSPPPTASLLADRVSRARAGEGSI